MIATTAYAIMTFLLAYATFLIGILLLSIPVPSLWMRQAGFELVADSYAAVFLFTIIVALYTATFSVLSFSTSMNSAAWLQLEKIEVVAAQTEISVPKNILETIAGLAPINLEPLVSTIESMYDIATGPMSQMLMSYALTLVALEYLNTFVNTYLWQLVFLGCVFWAIPGKIGRIAAGWMIAFPLVFYFGLPQLRDFLGWFTGYRDLVLAVNAAGFSNFLKISTSADIRVFAASVAEHLLKVGSDFAGQIILRIMGIGIFVLILGLVAGGFASLLSHASSPAVEGA